MLNPDMLKLRDDLFTLIDQQLQQIQECGGFAGSVQNTSVGYDKTFICKNGSIFKFTIQQQVLSVVKIPSSEEIQQAIGAAYEKSKSVEFSQGLDKRTKIKIT